MAKIINDKLYSLINGYNKIITETGKLPPPLKAGGNLSVKDLMDVIYYLMRVILEQKKQVKHILILQIDQKK